MENGIRIDQGTVTPSSSGILERVKRMLEADPLVPVIPEIAIKICQLTQSGDADLKALYELIAADPGLAATCLQTASSVGFAGRPIESLEDAVFLLGLDQIRAIVLNLIVLKAFNSLQTPLSGNDFWLHSFSVAKLTHTLVIRSLARVNPHAYLAGLLHDIGKLIIQRYFTEEYSLVLAGAVESKCSHSTMEKAVLNIDHAQIGACLCSRMSIHKNVIGAILFHHDSTNPMALEQFSSDVQELAAWISLADYLCHNSAAFRDEETFLVNTLSCLPPWELLSKRYPMAEIRLNVITELEKAYQQFTSLKS